MPIEYNPRALNWILAREDTARRYTKNRTAIATVKRDDGTEEVIGDGDILQVHKSAMDYLKLNPDIIVYFREDRENFL